MSDVERVTVVFSEPVAARLHAAVESGEYETTGEVIRDAVDQWAERQKLSEGDVAMLRHAWDEGIASGKAEPLDMKALLAEARANLTSGSRG